MCPPPFDCLIITFQGRVEYRTKMREWGKGFPCWCCCIVHDDFVLQVSFTNLTQSVFFFRKLSLPFSVSVLSLHAPADFLLSFKKNGFEIPRFPFPFSV